MKQVNRKNIKKNGERNKRLVGVLGLIAMVLFLVGFVSAQTDPRITELEQELNNLMQELEGADYSWVINYSGEVDGVFYNIINKFKYVKDYTTE